MQNHLKNQTSPYLLQHVNNPVDWYPWGEEAFQKAKEEDKPVFLSIGYSTCHWCHVMAHESFEDEKTARLVSEERTQRAFNLEKGVGQQISLANIFDNLNNEDKEKVFGEFMKKALLKLMVLFMTKS